MNDTSYNKPSPKAWFVFRCLARYFISLFVPCFRYFGETYFRNRGQLFILKDYGLLSWFFPLCIFKRPLRFVFVNKQEGEWFEMAQNGGLEPLLLSGELEADYQLLNDLLGAKEKILLIISQNTEDVLSKALVGMLKKNNAKETLFMGVSGAEKIFVGNSKTPKVVPVGLFCGMPYVPRVKDGEKAHEYEELHLLEKAVRNLRLEQEPSIFFNHERNK